MLVALLLRSHIGMCARSNPRSEFAQERVSVESRRGLGVRQCTRDVAGPVSVQPCFEACSDQFTFLGRHVGGAAGGVVDR